MSWAYQLYHVSTNGLTDHFLFGKTAHPPLVWSAVLSWLGLQAIQCITIHSMLHQTNRPCSQQSWGIYYMTLSLALSCVFSLRWGIWGSLRATDGWGGGLAVCLAWRFPEGLHCVGIESWNWHERRSLWSARPDSGAASFPCLPAGWTFIVSRVLLALRCWHLSAVYVYTSIYIYIYPALWPWS